MLSQVVALQICGCVAMRQISCGLGLSGRWKVDEGVQSGKTPFSGNTPFGGQTGGVQLNLETLEF